MLSFRFYAALFIDRLCFDVFVHNLASSKATVDLNKAKGMLLFNSVLVVAGAHKPQQRKWEEDWTNR